jgi:hypothetical protein
MIVPAVDDQTPQLLTSGSDHKRLRQAVVRQEREEALEIIPEPQNARKIEATLMVPGSLLSEEPP